MHEHNQESVLRLMLGALLLLGGSVIGTITLGATWTLAIGITFVTAAGAALCTHRASAWRSVRQLRKELADMERPRSRR